MRPCAGEGIVCRRERVAGGRVRRPPHKCKALLPDRAAGPRVPPHRYTVKGGKIVRMQLHWLPLAD